MTTLVKTGYAPVNGLELYHEIRGSGDPLVLLHGGVVGMTMFDSILPELASGRQVISVDLQGHGRTADVDRPLSFESMADDIAALIKHLGFENADVMGLSLGGGVALQVAFRHPRSVRKLVVVSEPCQREGWYPEVRADFDRMDPAAGEFMTQSPLAQLYPHVNWGLLFGKLGDLLRKDYDWSKQVGAIKAPTMIVFADADAIRPEHIVEFFGLLGGGKRDAGLDGSGRPEANLAILPGLTHYTISGAPALAMVANQFLDASSIAARQT